MGYLLLVLSVFFFVSRVSFRSSRVLSPSSLLSLTFSPLSPCLLLLLLYVLCRYKRGKLCRTSVFFGWTSLYLLSLPFFVFFFFFSGSDAFTELLAKFLEEKDELKADGSSCFAEREYVDAMSLYNSALRIAH